MTRTTLLLAATLLLPLAALPVAEAGYDLCDKQRLCISRDEGCTRAVWWLAMDFGVGAGDCATLGAGGACQVAWAGSGGLGGFYGVVLGACVGTQPGNVCVAPTAQVGGDPTVLNPLCLA